MTYPAGNPSADFSRAEINSSDFSPTNISAGVVDNFSPVNNITIRNSIGAQLALVQNFVNETYLGRESIPVTNGYITNIYSTNGYITNIDVDSITANTIETAEITSSGAFTANIYTADIDVTGTLDIDAGGVIDITSPAPITINSTGAPVTLSSDAAPAYVISKGAPVNISGTYGVNIDSPLETIYIDCGAGIDVRSFGSQAFTVGGLGSGAGITLETTSSAGGNSGSINLVSYNQLNLDAGSTTSISSQDSIIATTTSLTSIISLDSAHDIRLLADAELQITVGTAMNIIGLPSGANQPGGLSVGDLWHDTTDDTIKIVVTP